PERPAIDPRLFDAIKKPDPLVKLGGCLLRLSRRMHDADRDELALRVSALIAATDDLSTIRTLCQALVPLDDRLSPHASTRVAEHLVKKMSAIPKKPSRTGFCYMSLGHALVALGERLPAESALVADGEIRSMIAIESSPSYQEELVKILPPLVGRMTRPAA